MKKSLLLVIALFGAGLVMCQHATAAGSQTFTQQILPLNCTYEVIDTGTSTIRSLSPAECGQVVISSTTTLQRPLLTQSANGIPSAPAAANEPTGTPNPIPTSTVDLNTYPPVTAIEGQLLTVNVGQIITYTPLIGPEGSARHSIVVTRIDEQGVMLRLQPSGQTVGVTSNQTVLADYNEKNQPAVAIKLEGKPQHSRATLRFWLLNSKLAARDLLPQTKDTSGAYIALAAVTILLAATLYHFRYRKS